MGRLAPGMRGAESSVKLSRSGIPHPLVLVLLVTDYLETLGLYIICRLKRYYTSYNTLGASQAPTGVQEMLILVW